MKQKCKSTFSLLYLALTLLSVNGLNGNVFAADCENREQAQTVTSLFGKPSYYNIRDYGAKSDGKTINTQAIQKALDNCHKNGGGTVYIPPGDYVTGTLVLRSHTTLHLDKGATLLGSSNLSDYPEKIPAFRSFTDNYTSRSLIYAEKEVGISIIGEGVIDGRGNLFPRPSSSDNLMKVRPYLIRIIECQKVRIKDINLKNSAMWMQHYLACDDVQIDGITVTNHVQKNNDGIDIDGCQNVTISNCIIDCIDDAICLKSTSDRITKNVTINNCVVRTHCGGIDFGTESNGGFQNILINNICIDKAAEGISLKLVDGGEFNRVSISNVTMDGVKSPIFLRLGNRARPYLSRFTSNRNDVSFEVDDVEIPGMGSMKNIIISNVFATNASNWGCYITGIPGHYIENLTLKDINIQFAGGGKKEWAQRNIPENPTKYPGVNQFDGPSPAYAFFIRHVKNLRMENIRFEYEGKEARPALFCKDVDGIYMSDFHAEAPTEGNDAVIFEQVKRYQPEKFGDVDAALFGL